MPGDIPVLDFAQISSAPDTVAKDLLQACADWGFFYVKNHPIAQEAVDGIFDLEKRFFAQSDAVKSQAAYIPAQNAGFKPASSHSVSGRLTDPREAFSINKWPTTAHAASARLPPVLDEAREQIAAFQSSVRSFASRLLELVALALGLPSDQFRSQHDPTRENFDNFELMHYPPVEGRASASGSPSEQSNTNPFRISPHTDWGSITLLFQHDIGGLQVRPPSYTSATPDLESETWISAPVHNDMVLINIGDMLEFWTAGRLKSTWHRVVPTARHGAVDRYTFAYFLHPNKDAVLVPTEALRREGWVPRYEGIGRTAEEHIHARIRAVHGPGSGKETRDQVVVPTPVQEKMVGQAV